MSPPRLSEGTATLPTWAQPVLTLRPSKDGATTVTHDEEGDPGGAHAHDAGQGHPTPDVPADGAPRRRSFHRAWRGVETVASTAERAEQRVVAETGQIPSWLKAREGETRWPSLVAVATAIAIQLALPERISFGPRWLLPTFEIALAAGLLAANPIRFQRESPLIRRASLLLVAVISVANGASAILLLRTLLQGKLSGGAAVLLADGGEVYVTNIIAFALWYWELDRGGPMARAAGRRQHPDLLFPQMTASWAASPDWRPTFPDYLYTSYTNATAFSPTDTMPLCRWAKMLMLVQSAIALVTAALVIARAVNIFQ